MSTTPLSEIPTLTLLYKLNKLGSSSSPTSTATSRFNDQISLIRTDITTLETDAIVNAANESLLGGGGVDGAIHRAAGRGLIDECSELDGCDTGDAKITGAYKLPCKKVIHAVGPVYYSTKRKGMHTTLLQSCYTKSLDLAVENGCKSIAFSALSTGVYGYPSGEASETAIQAVKGWLEEDAERTKKIERVVFCQFMEKDQKAYEKYIPQYFTPSEEPAKDNEETEAEEHVVEGDKDGSTDQPAASKEEEAAAATNTEAEKIPDLSDVPTKEPKDADQPAVKKLKLDEDAKA